MKNIEVEGGRSVGRAAIYAFALLSVAALALFPYYSVYWDRPILTVIAAVILLAFAVHPRLAAIPNWLGRQVMRPSARAFGLIVFIVGAVLFSSLSLILFEGTPVLDDDVSALFQARIFLSGHLRLPAPQPADFFSIFAIISGTHGVDWLCSMYPYGHPLVLLPGLAMGVPWLVMPIFAAGTCVLAATLGRMLFCERTARLAALTCLFSPMFAELGSTFLNHAVTAFGAMLSICSVLRILGVGAQKGRGRGLVNGLLAGFGISLAFLCRPADAVVVGLLIGLAVMTHPRIAWSRRGPLAVAASVIVFAVVSHIMWTHVQTGCWLIPGHRFAGVHPYGFSRYFGPDKAVVNALFRSMALGAKATGWPVAVFFPALIPLLHSGDRIKAAWLWVLPLSLSTLYFFFFWYEYCFPARYLFVSVPALAVLASEGWRILSEKGRFPVSRLVFAPAALGALVFLPLHLSSFDDHWYDVERNLPDVIEKSGIHNAVVICDAYEASPDRKDVAKKYFAAAFMRNDLDFNGDIIYVRSRKRHDAELPMHFPGRSFYRYRYRRDLNKSELYRVELDPETGEQRHTFLIMSARGYLDPCEFAPSIPEVPIEPLCQDDNPPK